jgi:hypothetical protein
VRPARGARRARPQPPRLPAANALLPRGAGLDAEARPRFARRLEQLDPQRTWRRLQPTRVLQAGDVAGLEWLEDPRLIALFLAPRRPRRRRPRRPQPRSAAAAQPGLRFEVLRLF